MSEASKPQKMRHLDRDLAMGWLIRQDAPQAKDIRDYIDRLRVLARERDSLEEQLEAARNDNVNWRREAVEQQERYLQTKEQYEDLRSQSAHWWDVEGELRRTKEQKEASDVLLRDCLDYIEHMEKSWGGGIAGSVDLKRRIRDSFPASGSELSGEGASPKTRPSDPGTSNQESETGGVVKKNARIDLSGVDLTPYLRDIRLNPEPTTVRYTPFNYTGWRRWWRRLTFRPVESDTYEFEAEFSPDPEFLPGDDADDVTGFSYSFRATGPIRKVSNQDTKPS